MDTLIRPSVPKRDFGYPQSLGSVCQFASRSAVFELAKASYLRPDIVGQGLDIMVASRPAGVFYEPRRNE